MKTTKKHSQLPAILLFTLMVTAAFSVGAAQVNAEPTISLKLHKDFGYSSFGNDAQGNWTLQATVSEDTTRVEFYLDNQLQLDDTQTPFGWSYNTDNFPEGLHTLKAVAYDANGNDATAEVQQNFVPFPADFTIIIVIVVVVSVVISIVAALVMMKRNDKRKTR
jgi:hypothetical protein